MNIRKLLQRLAYLLLDRYRAALLSNSVEDVLPGVYCAEWHLIDHVVKDTLTITCLSPIGNIYEVTFLIETIRQHEGVTKIDRVRLDHWKGFYDCRSRQLIQMHWDKIVSFIPEHRAALYEDREIVKKY